MKKILFLLILSFGSKAQDLHQQIDDLIAVSDSTDKITANELRFVLYSMSDSIRVNHSNNNSPEFSFSPENKNFSIIVLLCFTNLFILIFIFHDRRNKER